MIKDPNRETFIDILEKVIKYNTFIVGDDTYLQKKRLPMGGPMSTVLSNIYLGHLESHFSSLPGILLFNSYVDDLLIISDLAEHNLHKVLQGLENSYKLHLTSSISNTSIVFLDMTLFISPTQNYIRVFPFG